MYIRKFKKNIGIFFRIYKDNVQCIYNVFSASSSCSFQQSRSHLHHHTVFSHWKGTEKKLRMNVCTEGSEPKGFITYNHNFVKICPILMVNPSNESLDIEFSTNHEKISQILISWFMKLPIWQLVIWQVPKWRQVASGDVMTSNFLQTFRMWFSHHYLACVKFWS